jgi:hypothetical protein
MSDSYQAIYDAVRSRISNGDVGSAVSEAARSAFDTGNLIPRLHELVGIIENALTRPSAVYRPSLSIDGNKWCALYGEDLMHGVCGFGDTPDAAMWDFDKAWNEKIGDRKPLPEKRSEWPTIAAAAEREPIAR